MLRYSVSKLVKKLISSFALIAMFAMSFAAIPVAESSSPLQIVGLPDASRPVAVGQGYGFRVSGGTAPYTVISANTGIARIDGPTQAGIWFVRGVAAGTTTIIATDATGKKVQGTVYVGTTKSLSISVVSTLLEGAKGELAINSGNPPYIVTTGPGLSVAFKGTDSYGRPIYTITATVRGGGLVTVKDAKGLTETRLINVIPYLSLSFPELTGNLRTIDVGQTTTLLVKDGKSPYTVRAIDPTLVSIQQQSEGRYSVTGRKAGVASIEAKDANGATRSLSLTVRDLPAMTVLAPATLNIGQTGTLSIVGGSAPFTVTPSGNQISLTRQEEKKFQIVAQAPGTAVITVRDSKGTVKSLNITISQPLSVSAPATLAVGQTGTLSVSGDGVPITASPSNNLILLNRLNERTFQIIAKAPGTTTITVRNITGTVKTLNITISQPPPPTPAPVPKLESTPTDITLILNPTGKPSAKNRNYQMINVKGGKGNYQLSASPSIVSITPQGQTPSGAQAYLITAKARGTTTLTITDQSGQKATVTIKIL